MVGARGDVAAAGEHRDAPAGAGPAVVAAAAAAAVGARCFAASTATGDEEEEQVVLPSSSGPSVNHSAFASADSKPFLGGYRNAAIGAVYHHAATQTDAAANHPRRQRGPQASTATQTGQPRSCGVQCPREASTQCPRPGWAEDVAQGRVVELGGQWEPAEQVVARRAKAALAIQRCVRGWLARRCAAAMRQAQQELEVFVAEQQARSQAAAERQRAHEVRRRMQPRTPADFVLLYDELAMWWGQEQEKIAAAEGVTGGQAWWVGWGAGGGGQRSLRSLFMSMEHSLLSSLLAHLPGLPILFPQRRGGRRRGGCCWPRRPSCCKR